MTQARRSRAAARKSPGKVARTKVAADGREATPPGAFSSEDIAQILKLLKGASSVEVKLSVPEGHRAAARGLGLDPVEA